MELTEGRGCDDLVLDALTRAAEHPEEHPAGPADGAGAVCERCGRAGGAAPGATAGTCCS
ncbi:hypothetical protein ACFQ2M_39250 [Kitasatospora saccharophila]|uniref:hypothetical protein n=1 Tax=Kitasatospora saccharophila TaxID=407973 RepID=UPI00363D5C5F